MRSPKELLDALNQILQTMPSERKGLVSDFQEEVWNDESLQDSSLDEILSELAYDLDFYEPNSELRKEDHSYYGEERLEELIKSGIQKILEYQKQTDCL